MQWRKTHDKKFVLAPYQYDLQAEVVGDKIYFASRYFDEFFVYDPASNKILKTEGLPPKQNLRIKSFKNTSIIFRIDYSSAHVDFEYQYFVNSAQPDQKKVASSAATSHMEYLWKEKPFADVTFVVQNEEILAHRVILLKCRYFQNMLKSGMIEANSHKINVPDISLTNFRAILEYVYCDKIELTEPLAMELIILADMYFLSNLKGDCEKYLSEKLTFTNFIEIMKVAQTADSEKLEKRVVGFLATNIEKIREEIDIHAIPPELFIKAIVGVKSKKK